MFVIFFTFLLFGFHDIIADVSFPDTENPNQDRFVINAVIHQLFEQFRSLVKNGDINKNIPVLDPYELYSSTYQIDGGFISVSLNISNGVFSGLGAFKRGPLTFQKRNLSIEVELTFPLLSFSSDYYELEGKVFEIFPLSGKGMMQIEVRNMVIKGKIYLKQSVDEKSILVSDFENLEFTIENIESHTQFDGNIDEIANAMIAELLPDYLTRFSRAICATYGGVMVQALNSILDKYDTWKIIAIIL